MDTLNADIYDFILLYGTAGKALLLAYSFIIGACFGSFTTACVWRIPRNISIVWPPSSCPKCGHRITPLENIPIFSWIFLRGKCSSCGLPISPRYVLLETATALLFLLTAWSRMHFVPEQFLSVIPDWIMIVFAAACACTDIELRIIPNKFTYTAIVLGLICAWFMLPGFGVDRLRFGGTQLLYVLLHEHGMGWALSGVCVAAASGAAVWIFFYCAAWAGELLFRREAFGMGDVKMLAAVAVFQSVQPTLFITAGACLLSVLFVVFCRLRGGKFLKTVPFGPFISASLAAWLFVRPLLCVYGG